MGLAVYGEHQVGMSVTGAVSRPRLGRNTTLKEVALLGCYLREISTVMRNEERGVGSLLGRHRGAFKTELGSSGGDLWCGVCELSIERIRPMVSLLASLDWRC